MEQYEFKAKCPVSMWIAGGVLFAAAVCYGILRQRYEYIVMWGIYFAVSIISSIRTFTVTPQSFTVKAGWSKPKTFSLKEIVEIERIFTKNGQPKSLIVRYMHSGMPHNFIEIRRANVDIDSILRAVLEYYPEVKVC